MRAQPADETLSALAVKATALIIDDEPDIRELVVMSLARIGLDCHSAANLAEARNLLDSYAFDVCLTDMKLPDGNGVAFVAEINRRYPGLPVAVITAHGDMHAAVEAMKNGAFDFVSKPVDIQLLRRLVLQAIGSASGEEQPTAEKSQPSEGSTQNLTPAAGAEHVSSLVELSGRSGGRHSAPPDRTKEHDLVGGERLVGDSLPIQELRALIRKVARTNAPVWITGESGTGKELIARLIHDNSARAEEDFVAINCGAIPSELMESEFFGHKKGSFTGAIADHDGLFRQADGGTLFLDEIAELPLHMQVKLLRAIQERAVRTVGSGQETPVDVRLLSASHRHLATEVEAGRFRHDLYYRLNVIALRAPPLRERRSDIGPLARHILTQHARLQGNRAVLHESALRRLENHPFPGNVRELENLLERALALAEGPSIMDKDLMIGDFETLPQHRHSPEVENGALVTPSAAQDDREHILRVLEELRWNRKLAAERLGLTYRQLRYRLQQLNISSDRSTKR